MPVSLLTASLLNPPSLPASPSTPIDQAPTSILRRESVAISETDSERSLTFAIAAPRPGHLGPPLRFEESAVVETPWAQNPFLCTSEYDHQDPAFIRGRTPSIVNDRALPGQSCSRHRSPPPRARASSERPRQHMWDHRALPSGSSGRRRGSVPAVLLGGLRGSDIVPSGLSPTGPPQIPRSFGGSTSSYLCPPTVDTAQATARCVSPRVDDLSARLGNFAKRPLAEPTGPIRRVNAE